MKSENLSPTTNVIRTWLPRAARECLNIGMSELQAANCIAFQSLHTEVSFSEITAAVDLVYGTELSTDSPLEKPTSSSERAKSL
jgi:hypothetical protein